MQTNNKQKNLKETLTSTNDFLYTATFIIAGVLFLISFVFSFIWGRNSAHLGPGSRGSGDYTYFYIAFSLSIMCSGIIKLLNKNTKEIENASGNEDLLKIKNKQKLIKALLVLIAISNSALLYLIHSVFKL